jgi:hypothetical protein
MPANRMRYASLTDASEHADLIAYFQLHASNKQSFHGTPDPIWPISRVLPALPGQVLASTLKRGGAGQ